MLDTGGSEGGAGDRRSVELGELMDPSQALTQGSAANPPVACGSWWRCDRGALGATVAFSVTVLIGMAMKFPSSAPAIRDHGDCREYHRFLDQSVASFSGLESRAYRRYNPRRGRRGLSLLWRSSESELTRKHSSTAFVVPPRRMDPKAACLSRDQAGRSGDLTEPIHARALLDLSQVVDGTDHVGQGYQGPG